MKNGGKITCALYRLVDKEWESGYWYVPIENCNNFEYYIKKDYKFEKVGVFDFDVTYLQIIAGKREVDENLTFFDNTVSH